MTVQTDRRLSPDAAEFPPAPEAIGPYSLSRSFGGLVFVSGQLPVDASTGSMPESFGDQTRQSLMNARSILADHGLSLNDVVKTTVFVTDLSRFGEVNEAYGEFFTAPHPARACIEVAGLPKGAGVEIELIAARGAEN